MVNSVIGYAATIAFDIIIFLILFCMFIQYRKKRSKRIEVQDPNLKKEIPPDPIIFEADKPLGQLLSEIRNLSDEELCRKTTPEAVLYLVLLRYIRNMLNIFAFWGMTILVPLYVVADDGDDLNMMMGTTIANLGNRLEFGIAPAILIPIFSMIGYGLVMKFISEINTYSRKVKDDSLTSATMEIYGIPWNSDINWVSQELEQKIMKKYWNQVARVLVIPNLAEAYAQFKIKVDCENQLENYYALCEKKEERPQVGTWWKFCKKVDAIEHFEQKRNEAMAKSAVWKAENENKASYVAFLVWYSQENMENVLQTIKDEEFWQQKLFAAPATSPNNIIWENLNAQRAAGQMKGSSLTMFFFFLVFFLFTPTFFIGILTFIIGDVAGAIIGGYLPVIFLAMYTSILIPLIIEKWVELERHHTKGSAVNGAMVKYLLFLTGQIFVLPVIVQPILMSAHQEGDLSKIPHMICFLGLQLGQLIALKAFVWMGLWLLQFVLVIERFVNAKRACTPRTEAMAWATRPFDLPYYQAWYLVIMMISFCYATIAPIVTLIGAIYMNIRFQVDKYNIWTLFFFDLESNGVTPRKAVSFMLVSIFFFQVLGGAMLFGLDHSGYYVVGGFYIIAAVILLILGLCKTDEIFFEKQTVFDKTPIDIEEAVQLYTHPLQKEEIIATSKIEIEVIMETTENSSRRD